MNFRVIAAFAIIYVVWGSTYLGIRVAVATIPPLLAAGVRFTIAGALLYGYARLRSHAAPTRTEWQNMALVSLFLFLLTYAPEFWAAQYLPSGLMAVLTATMPLATLLLETFVFRHTPFSLLKTAAALVGFAGVAILVETGAGGQSQLVPTVAILAAAFAWALGSVLSHSQHFPPSKLITAGAEMLVGGLALLVCSALAGEWSRPPRVSAESAWALLYLIVFGSIVAFTAFVWLLSHMPASAISSYAYVNPVIAVLLGCLLLHEALTRRMIVGSVLILLSVVLTLSYRPAPEVAP